MQRFILGATKYATPFGLPSLRPYRPQTLPKCTGNSNSRAAKGRTELIAVANATIVRRTASSHSHDRLHYASYDQPCVSSASAWAT